MLGSIAAAVLVTAGVSLPFAALLGVAIAGFVGLIVEKLAIEPARDAQPVTLIITLGVALILRGLVQIFIGKGAFMLPPFTGDTPVIFFGASILPQSLWAIGVAVVTVAVTAWFFNKTLLGKAMRASSHNKFAAQLVGVDVQRVLLISFFLSALLGAIGGIVVAPITYTSYEIGIMLGVKGFVAAVLGGLGSGAGAVLGGLLLGLLEALTAGYVSSAYKDAVPFIVILLVLFLRPEGLLGKREVTRV